jgi:hypothetical protein
LLIDCLGWLAEQAANQSSATSLGAADCCLHQLVEQVGPFYDEKFEQAVRPPKQVFDLAVRKPTT